METKNSLLQTVLQWPLSQVTAWLDGHAVGEPVGQEDFNWDLFAFTAARRAREERSLPWAHIALRVYAVLAERSPVGSMHSFMLSAMSLRAWMINELGAREGDTVLDPEIIFGWFQRVAVVPLEEAARLVDTQDWSTLPIETLRELRSIKNALNVLSFLPETEGVRRHPELEGWLQLRSRLP